MTSKQFANGILMMAQEAARRVQTIGKANYAVMGGSDGQHEESQAFEKYSTQRIVDETLDELADVMAYTGMLGHRLGKILLRLDELERRAS